MIVDTNVVVDKFKSNKEVVENITIITAIEFPPMLKYKKFHGKVYTIKPEDQALAIRLQRLLRKIGKPKPSSDILIASICINRNEELTKDKDFLNIAEISELKFRLLE